MMACQVNKTVLTSDNVYYDNWQSGTIHDTVFQLFHYTWYFNAVDPYNVSTIQVYERFYLLNKLLYLERILLGSIAKVALKIS